MTDEQPQPRDHFWLLTIATNTGTSTFHGIVPVDPGVGEYEMFTSLAKRWFPQAMPAPVVLAWVYRPNQT